MDRALERDAKVRYQTASEFGRALYEAVEKMPEPLEASAGTLAMGAVPAHVPPTRLGAAAVKTRRRPPILIGIGLAAALLVGGIVYVTRSGNAEKVAPATGTVAAARQDSSASQPFAARPADSLPGSKDKGAPARESPGIEARVASVVAMSTDSPAARRALDEVTALAPQATSRSAHAGLGLARAQALAFLRRDAEACASLRSVKEISVGTRYESDISRLLKLSC
jgi:hypothetical protein